jgi:polysaccharide pyruvyl transferase WcaK-like protein
MQFPSGTKNDFAAAKGEMRIVVDTALNAGDAEYANLGDVSMLQVGVRRLRRLWPSATIEVLTDSPSNLARFCPDAEPLARAGRDIWVGDTAFLGFVDRLLPRAVSVRLSSLVRSFRLHFPTAFRLVTLLRLAIRDQTNVRSDLISFLNAMKQANLFVVCGSGGFSDSSRMWDISTLNTVEEAVQRKVPVAMFGQGMGPLNDEYVRGRMRKVLPKVSLLTLRGGRGGWIMAQSLGLNRSRMLTTGDEAIELAYDAKPQELGHAIGINLRVASHSKVGRDMIEKLRPILHEMACRHNAPLIPVPIAFHSWATDHLTIQKLLKGLDDNSDGGITLDTPLKVIQQAGRCRIVVTGAYHAAVFALSQGIPVVGLSASDYYTAKFLGLEDQFGPGCETVFMDAADFPERLTAAVERAWQSADQVRLPLQDAARRQIKLSQGAYDRIRDRLTSSETGADLEGGVTESNPPIATSPQ